ncbi:MAG: exosporium glycoprotein BclB-related protein [Bacteroidota bacterium]
MKRNGLSLLCLALSFPAISQRVAIGTNTPHANAALEIKSTTNKGLLIPRGNNATRTALNSNTAKGLMLYDTTTNSLWIHNGNGLASGWTDQQITNSGTIIPYASGSQVALSKAYGEAPDMALLGFGNNVSGVITSAGNINLTGFPGYDKINYAFSVPRAGIITSVSAFFSSAAVSTTLGSSGVTVTARLYISTLPNNIFSPLPAILTLGPFYGIPVQGTVSSETTTGLAIAVPAGSRLLLAFSATTTDPLAAYTFNGFASAGVTIQ